MFTGLVEDKGKVIDIGRGNLTVRTKLDDISTGDSLMVNGVCLTVVKKESKNISVDMGSETRRVTSLSGLSKNEPVNLERALKLTDRMGGHFVYGHVWETGKLLSKSKKKNTLILKIQARRSFIQNLMEKGSVAVEGISLTVNETAKNFFSVGIIPETLKRTNLKEKKKGDPLNLEPDMLLAAGKKYGK
ncbi:MAG: riboflavin synthase [Elusimicrobiota bacterium]